MTRWELPETHALIETAFGAAQLKLTRESIRSLVDREHYASYHFREASRLTKDFERRHLKDGILLEIYTQQGERKRLRLAAPGQACSLSLRGQPQPASARRLTLR